MAKKPETLFKERIRPRLMALSHSWWVKTQMISFLGIPDYLGCVNGQFVALELKKDDTRKSKASALQRWTLRKIIQAGGIGLVVEPGNFEAIYVLLVQLSKAKRFFESTRIKLQTLDS